MLKLYNSLTREKEEFKPYAETVQMYSCGPTVYSYAHIGNMRAYLFMDSIRRTLKYNNFKINGVMNFTDVGHMTSDADEGKDKMMLASERENKSPYEIAKFYTNFFMEQAKKLDIDMPEHLVPATSTIDDIIAFVKKLVKDGYGYETSKGIYFDVQKFKDYGMLSGSKLDGQIAGARIDIDHEKRHPADFTLWVKAPKEHIMQWDSPWGKGYPGWHIECSAISRKYLGDHIDIHTGGVDHRPIHHENEIAQSDCLEKHKVVKIWMHVEFLQVDGGKMGKSLNNMYTLKDLEDKGFDPLCFRYFYLTAHYSKQQNFTFEALSASQNALTNLKNILKEHKQSQTKTDLRKLEEYSAQFLEAVNDDLNMPQALSVVWTALKEPRSNDIFKLIEKFNQVLGLPLEDAEQFEPEIIDLAEKRLKARRNKDWATSDNLRDLLKEKHKINILDKADGYELSKIK